jgi:hypothetical protein
LHGQGLSHAKALSIWEEVMYYLVAAYAVLWAISFGLIASFILRQRKLQAELRILRQVVEDQACK